MATPAPSASITRRRTDELIVGFVSTSSRASAGTYQDEGILMSQDWSNAALFSPQQRVERLIPSDQAAVVETLIDLVNHIGCDLVSIMSGTGPTRRDVTPETTLAVATREMSGSGEQMRQINLHFVPAAALSRQAAVIRETPLRTALITNLPGQSRTIRETFEGLKDVEGRVMVPGIFAAVPYCIGSIGGPYIETRDSVVRVWRPKHAVRARPLQV